MRFIEPPSPPPCDRQRNRAILPYVERHPFQFPNGVVVLVADPATTRSNVTWLLIVAVLAALVPTVNALRMRILDAIWGR